ncbi:MAG: DUF763 domain-containing protein [Nitrososphaeria archaeon]|nr:DUF763 domain-containing protein [Aigarchaeota archaeon]MCX8187335.1 DUF763 domain-containing protein [Nitrososphaeria archaeon]MDW8021131.1 DUF763 domain-containing protein [Nitrososphaerota archaeon]
MYRAGLRELRILHASKPKWYFRTVENALEKILESYIELFGAKKFMLGLASPVFFDGLSASAYLDELEGGATSIIAAILRNFIKPEMGIAIVGGKRPEGYRVPEELDRVAEIFGFDEETLRSLKYASKMVAKVDSAAIQDGFELYIHIMVVSCEGEWVIIQQGLKPVTNIVRRYHWASINLRSFVEEPHSGIVSAERQGLVIDMTSCKSSEARAVCVEAVNTAISSLRRLYERLPPEQSTLLDLDAHERRKCPFTIPRIKWSTILQVNRSAPRNFEELLSLHGVGPAVIRFLAAASIELYDTYPSLEDPAILFSEVPTMIREDKWLYELVDAIKSSRMSLIEKKKSLSRLSNVFRLMDEFS